MPLVSGTQGLTVVLIADDRINVERVKGATELGSGWQDLQAVYFNRHRRFCVGTIANAIRGVTRTNQVSPPTLLH